MKKLIFTTLIAALGTLAFAEEWAAKLADSARSILADKAPQAYQPAFVIQETEDAKKLKLQNATQSNLLVMAAKLDSPAILYCSFVAPRKNLEIADTGNSALYILNAVDGVRHPAMRVTPDKLSVVDVKTLEALAKRGNPFSQFVLGTYNLRGEGTEQSFESAYENFTQSAAKDNPAAMLALSQMFRDGMGVEKNEKTSFEYANAAVSFGYMPAFTYVGYAYARGLGVEKDIPKALRYLEQAAHAGDDSAMLCLALIYRSDFKDHKKSMEYIDLAIKHGNTFALELKAENILKAENTDAGKLKAAELYIQAAERNWPTAAFKLEELKKESHVDFGKYFDEVVEVSVGLKKSKYVKKTDLLLRKTERNVLDAYRLAPEKGFYVLALLYEKIDPGKSRLNMAYAYSLMKDSGKELDDSDKTAIYMGTVEYLWKNAKQIENAIALCEKTYARFKNVEALVELANIYSSKDLDVFNPDKALEYCIKAKEAGYDYTPLKARILASKNMYAEIEELYLGKDGGKLSELSNKDKARLIFKMADDVDTAIHAEELSKNPRPEKLNEWYAKAAELDNADALSRRGECFEYEKNNLEEALAHYEKAANISASSEGMLNLSRAYAVEKFGKKNADKSNALLEKWKQAHVGEKSLKDIDILRLISMGLDSKPIRFIEDLQHADEFMKLARSGRYGVSNPHRTAEYKAKLLLAAEELEKAGASIDPEEDAAFICREAISLLEAKGDEAGAEKYREFAQKYAPMTFADDPKELMELVMIDEAEKIQRLNVDPIDAAHVAKKRGEFEKYFGYVQKAAETKSPETMIMLANAHRYAIGTPKNLDESERILIECAANPNLPDKDALRIANLLVEIYLSKGDEAKAQKVFAKADQNLYLKAAGNFYLKSREYAKAFAIFSALNKIKPSAETKLIQAEMTLYGLGTEADPIQASKEYTETVKSLSVSTMERNIGIAGMTLALERSGQKGLSQQNREVLAKYEGFYTGNPNISVLFALAQKEEEYAMNLLGMYCLKVKKDHARARAWFGAAGSELEMSKTNSEKITKEEIAESKKLAWEIFDSLEKAVGCEAGAESKK